MTSLDVADPLRFTLTQPSWERVAANFSHAAFYVLLFALPLSGWAMVSVSTLNIDTLLFNRIEWPHLPLLHWLNIADSSAQEILEHRIHVAHAVAGNITILLLIVHVAAALKHHYKDKDDVLNRMSPRFGERSFQALLAGVVIAIAASAYAFNHYGSAPSKPLVASGSSVELVAQISSSSTLISFSDTNVVANLDLGTPANSTLEASVQTAAVQSVDLQVQGSLPDKDWFDAENFPQAEFVATEFIATQQPNTLQVTGNLTIKDTTLRVNFDLIITTDDAGKPVQASAEFPVDRFAFKLGTQSQPNEDYVQATVLIRVNFELSTEE